jgi:hypothetical protein
MKTKLNEELDHIRLELRAIKAELFDIHTGAATIEKIPEIRRSLDNIISFMEEDQKPATWSIDTTIRRFL